jgi:hypothetical protein
VHVVRGFVVLEARCNTSLDARSFSPTENAAMLEAKNPKATALGFFASAQCLSRHHTELPIFVIVIEIVVNR